MRHHYSRPKASSLQTCNAGCCYQVIHVNLLDVNESKTLTIITVPRSSVVCLGNQMHTFSRLFRRRGIAATSCLCVPRWEQRLHENDKKTRLYRFALFLWGARAGIRSLPTNKSITDFGQDNASWQKFKTPSGEILIYDRWIYICTYTTFGNLLWIQICI